MRLPIQGHDLPLASLTRRFLAESVTFALTSVPLSLKQGYIDEAGAFISDYWGGEFFYLRVIGLICICANLLLFGRGQSIGKKLFGIRVVRAGSNTPVGFWRMLFRELIGKWAFGAVLRLGYLWAIGDSRKQSWIDKIFRTLVVRDS